MKNEYEITKENNQLCLGDEDIILKEGLYTQKELEAEIQKATSSVITLLPRKEKNHEI